MNEFEYNYNYNNNNNNNNNNFIVCICLSQFYLSSRCSNIKQIPCFFIV